MRYSLTVVGVLFVSVAAACGGTSNHGASTGNAGTGTGTGGGDTTGGTSGGAIGSLPAGATCDANASCRSGICGVDGGVDGGFNCCEAACATESAICGAVGCDNSGACTYPTSGLNCAPSSCSGDKLTLDQCDGFGNCFINPAVPCAGNYSCSGDRTDCNTTCKAMSDCASGFYCEVDAGTCLAQVENGPCTSNAACTSNICGLKGKGNCCTATCTNTAAPCGATGCDSTSGACVFPDTTVLCGPGGATSCTEGVETNPNVFCNGNGVCPSTMISCAPFVCGATACLTTCSDDTSCTTGTAYCDQDAGVDGGACLNKIEVGPCLSDDACLTGICGIAGTGHCCQQVCTNTTPPCGTTDCDATDGSCTFPDSTTLCGNIPESCSAGVQQDPSACDGIGDCDTTPGTTACTPFICGANACLVTCTDASSCINGDFCDTATGGCCTPIAAGGAIDVDSANGSDSEACCGYGSGNACKTIGHAMALIDGSKAKNVTINANLGGTGGDWAAGETYPIVLGWGAELSAPGVYFLDRNGANKAIIDIAPYSANDTIGYASIVGGGGASQVGVGLSAAHNLQLSDQSAIRIENGMTLYLADAILNGSALGTSSAIFIAAGGGLVLGQDQPGTTQGTVTIGNDADNFFSDGWDGIYCDTGTNLGCTISDATLTGQSSLVIQGQEDVDITAQDYASISLTSAPMIGIAPVDGGFGECPRSSATTPGSAFGKPDVSSTKGQAIWLDGKATMTFSNGTVQCISGAGFKLETSPNGNGNPSLLLQNSTVQNTERAVYVSAGTATLSGALIQFNYNGVEQTTDGTNIGTVNLSGSDGGTNTVICSSGSESITSVDGGTSTPGVDVLNDTSATLDAVDVAWDTSGPDVFSCNAALLKCTCQNSTCTNPGGVDDMDAVDDSTGTITTTGATVSPIATANQCN